jgi:hypothetical protein
LSLILSSTKSRISRVPCLSVTCALCLARDSVSGHFGSSSVPTFMTPHRIRAAVPDPCGLPCVFYFPRLYPRATWWPTSRTAAAQQLLAHYFLSLFKGEAVLLPLLLRICSLRTRTQSSSPPALPSPFAARAPFSDELQSLLLLRCGSPPRRGSQGSFQRRCIDLPYVATASLRRRTSSTAASSPFLRRAASSTSCTAPGWSHNLNRFSFPSAFQFLGARVFTFAFFLLFPPFVDLHTTLELGKFVCG